ncbi:hypothetical protein DV515_00019742, partial [Chloebia gouldiae]
FWLFFGFLGLPDPFSPPQAASGLEPPPEPRPSPPDDPDPPSDPELLRGESAELLGPGDPKTPKFAPKLPQNPPNHPKIAPRSPKLPQNRPKNP